MPELPVEFGQLLRVKFRAMHDTVRGQQARNRPEQARKRPVLSKEPYRAFPDEHRAFFGCCVHVGVLQHREHRSGAFWVHFANRKIEIAKSKVKRLVFTYMSEHETLVQSPSAFLLACMCAL